MKELLARLFARPEIAAELIAASLFANLLALASPLFVIQVLNRYVAHGVDSTLATLTVGVIFAITLEFGFRQARLKIAAAINAPFDEALSVGGFTVLTGAKAAAMDLLPPGLRQEFLTGGDAIQTAYSAPNVAAILDVPFALLFVVALFLLSPVLAIIALVFLLGVFLVAVTAMASMRGPTKELAASSGRRSALAGSAMVAGDTVRAFNSAGFMRRLWQKEGQVFHTLRRRLFGRQGTIQSLTQGAQGLMSVTVIAVGATQVVTGSLDVGAMIGANILAARALGPIVKVAQLSEPFAKARQALDMFREFARLPLEPTQGTGLREYKGRVEFKDVAFTHRGANTPLFESLSMTLAPGSVLLVSGGNGTGKTTLARLLVGLLEPTRGQILVDGVDLAQVAPEWWRKQVVYFPQEPRLLNGTLRENLLAANEALDDRALDSLVSAAGLRAFIDESPQGLDAPVIRNGENLSLGIRRRLALARALVNDGRLAIFDEPTEGLDAEGTRQVYAVLNDLTRRGRTIVVFAHDTRAVGGAHLVLDLNVKPVPRLGRVVPAPAEGDTAVASDEAKDETSPAAVRVAAAGDGGGS